MEKVFGIGLSKSGTSTLRDALEILGYTVHRMDKRILRDVLKGDTASAFAAVEKSDAFQDLPWPLLYKELFRKYGTSARYILTTRRSTHAWVNSIRNHIMQKSPHALLTYHKDVYGYPYVQGHEDHYAAYYETHNAEVRAFFEAQGAGASLLTVCWEEGNGWPELCAFLGREVPEEPFPHANPSSGFRPRRLRRFLNGLMARLFAGRREAR